MSMSILKFKINVALYLPTLLTVELGRSLVVKPKKHPLEESAAM